MKIYLPSGPSEEQLAAEFGSPFGEVVKIGVHYDRGLRDSQNQQGLSSEYRVDDPTDRGRRQCLNRAQASIYQNTYSHHYRFLYV